MDSLNFWFVNVIGFKPLAPSAGGCISMDRPGYPMDRPRESEGSEAGEVQARRFGASFYEVLS